MPDFKSPPLALRAPTLALPPASTIVPPPTMPARRPLALPVSGAHVPALAVALLALVIALALAPSTRAQPAALSVNTASREEVRQFFRAVYSASENVPMRWTGSYAAPTGPTAFGDTSPAFKEATRLRINFYRALVGIPADITFNPDYNAKAQQAALMISANNTLDHFPPATWSFYTAAGAEAAANSNLALGSAGAAAIDSYIADAGSNNAAVGHRRWLFYPQTLRMGTGDVAGDTTRVTSNAVWVVDDQLRSPRPPTRTVETTYPPAGFVPYRLVWPRWSFSYPGANFSAANVAMTRNGQPVPTRLEPLSPRPGTNELAAGEPTLVWVYDNQNTDNETAHPRPTADVVYTVTVSNVLIGSTPRTFTYQVTVFDPDVPSVDAAPVSISGSTTPALGNATPYTVAKPTFASGFDWRTLELTPFTKLYNAESGLDGLIATTSAGYDVVQSALTGAGSAAYRLAHTRARGDESLQLPGSYLVSTASSLSFLSRLGIATADATARVQVSTDDGISWLDLYQQPGTSTSESPTPVESAFVLRTVPLAAYAGRTVTVRFVFSLPANGRGFDPGPTNAVGWFIDNVTLGNTQLVSASAPQRITAGTTFNFAPASAGPVALQARGVIAGAYPLEWGPAFPTTAVVTEGAAGAGYLANLSVRSTAGAGDNSLIVGFAISGGTKPLLVRGIGPALTAFGVPGALTDPRLEILSSGGARVAENDSWNQADAPAFGPVGAFNLPPNSRDAVVLQPLAAGSYTAQVSGNGGATGIALVELYDTAGGSGAARLVNVSARSQVGTGDNILVTGFSIAGAGPRRLLIRAVGPTLTAFGVSGALNDPKLELFASGRLIEENDNWSPADRSHFASVGAFDLTSNSRDAVLVARLAPGSYTAQVSGVSNATGVALVEVYELP